MPHKINHYISRGSHISSSSVLPEDDSEFLRKIFHFQPCKIIIIHTKKICRSFHLFQNLYFESDLVGGWESIIRMSKVSTSAMIIKPLVQ